MAANEEIETLLSELRQEVPSEQFKNIDRSTAGVRAILAYLSHEEGRATAGQISSHMHVSTARVAVLLKKMLAKGLIVKESDPHDRRIVVVTLSEEGKKLADEMKKNLFTQVGEMIDKVGMERMMEFCAIARELRTVLPPPDIHF